MKNARRTLGIAIKLAIAIAIIALLFTKLDMGRLIGVLQEAGRRWPWLLLAQMLLLAGLMICVMRWRILLRALDFQIAFHRVFSIFFIGHFFNSFMPGGTGGDLAKAYYAARETHHRKTEAITSILIDRLIGLVALSLLVVCMIALRLNYFLTHPRIIWACATSFGICAGALAVITLMLSVNLVERIPFIARWRAHPRAGKIIDIFARGYNAFYVLRKNPRVLARTIVISSGVHCSIVIAEYAVSKALGLTVPFVDFLTLVPVIGIISAIPITPGGLGLREAITIQLFNALGVPDEKALLLGFIPYLGMAIWGLYGGALFIFTSGSGGRPPLDIDETEDVKSATQ